MGCVLLLNVLPYDLNRRATAGAGKVEGLAWLLPPVNVGAIINREIYSGSTGVNWRLPLFLVPAQHKRQIHP